MPSWINKSRQIGLTRNFLFAVRLWIRAWALKQLVLLYAQIQAESEMERTGSEVIVCDRGVLDHWAYTKHLFGEALEQNKLMEICEMYVVNHCRGYDFLAYLPIEFAPVDDGTREDDVNFHLRSRAIELIKSRATRIPAPSGSC